MISNPSETVLVPLSKGLVMKVSYSYKHKCYIGTVLGNDNIPLYTNNDKQHILDLIEQEKGNLVKTFKSKGINNGTI